VAEAMPHPVFTADAFGRLNYGNRAWYDFSGLNAEQTRTGGWVCVVHPSEAARAGRAWNLAVATGEPYEDQLRIRRAADGKHRWCMLDATPVHDAGGAVVSWIGSIRDVHDLKIATETRNVLDTMGHIIAIRNDDGSLEYVSPSWSLYTGRTSKSDAETIATFRELVHPDDRVVVDRQIRVSGELPLRMQQDEIRVRAVDGAYRWFLARTVALAQTAGTLGRRLNILTDIDEIKRGQAAAIRSETRYRALTDAIPQLVWVVDAQANLEYVNERWTTYTGLLFESGRPGQAAVVAHPDDRGSFAATYDAHRPVRDYECELRLRRHDGVYRWHLLRSIPLTSAAESAARWIVTATDIEARRAVEAALAQTASELKRRAHHDPLTNLPNRSALLDRLTQMIVTANRDGTSIVILYLDIDHFKAINDTLGHAPADKLLVEVAGRINSVLRSDDMASRFGGDEFVVVCTAAGAQDADNIADRIRGAVCVPIEFNAKRIVVSCSIGVSVFPFDGCAAADLIQKADSAMEEAKQNGRYAWRRYDTQTHVPNLPTLELEAELHEAIALEQFVVHYQPIIGLESGRPIGAEALIRWQHPERGLVGPAEFIPFAENHGLIAPIGELVLHAACAQLRRMNLRAGDDFTIAVNVSAHQFQKPGFVETIAAAIAAHGIEARRLEIEITESVVMYNTVAVIATLDKLKALGVKLSIDDFGTGYSSLAYLKSFPIHTLKIDRSFVCDMERNRADQAIAKTIVTLAHSLGMRVVAEGVETSEQLELLRSFGSDCIQGFLFSRPLAPPDFDDFMAGRRLTLDRQTTFPSHLA
jgi:diguanylate cyclase (GGDEF)-like protein/PAS domain S-box-containing protein